MPAAHGKAPSGGTAPGGSAPGAAPRRRRQLSTPARLRRLLAAVVAATILFWIAATIVQQGLRAAAHSARDVLSPSYQDAVQARAALSDADLAAWQAFGSGAAQLTGPGLQYQSDITNAGETLERLAALQVPGSTDSSLLQTVSGQLVSYQSLVEQADAEYRRDIALGAASKGGLGFAYLNGASSTMRDPGGLLASVDKLAGPGQQALRRQLASPWANRALPLVFAVPALLALSGIAAAQIFLRRRFKRAISLPLLLAAAATCGLASWLFIATWQADSAFAAARGTALPSLAGLWQSQTKAVDAEAAMLRANPAPGGSAASSAGLNPSATQRVSGALDADLASAANAGGLPTGIPVLAAATVILCYAAFRPRLNEYRAIPEGAGGRLRAGRGGDVLPAGGAPR
jgi:hypothetical protein